MAKFAEWVTKFAITADGTYRNIVDKSEIGPFEGDYITSDGSQETVHFTFLRAAVWLWENGSRDRYDG